MPPQFPDRLQAGMRAAVVMIDDGQMYRGVVKTIDDDVVTFQLDGGGIAAVPADALIDIEATE